MVTKELGIILLPHSTEHHSAEIGIGLQHSWLHAEALHMLHTRHVGQTLHDCLVHHDGFQFLGTQALITEHLYVCTETKQLGLHFALESQSHRDAYEHDCHTNGHPQCGYADGRT